MDYQALLEKIKSLSTLTADELVALRAELVQAVQDHPDSTDEDLKNLTKLVDAVNTLKGEITHRVTRNEAAKTLKAQVAEPVVEEVKEPVVETPAEPAVAEVKEPVAEPVVTEPVVEEIKEPVAASVTTLPAPAAAKPPAKKIPGFMIKPDLKPFVASGDIDGVPAGTELNYLDAAKALIARAEVFRGPSPRGDEKVTVFKAYDKFPEDLTVRPMDTYWNGLMLAKVSQDAANHAAIVASGEDPAAYGLTAAGGFCAELAPAYSYLNISTTGRPVRDSLPAIAGVRGGFSYTTPVDFTDFEGAIDQWTETDDINALTDENVRKPCIRIDCGETNSVKMYAVTKCFTLGNLTQMAWPELVADALEKGVVAQNRFAERLLLQQIDTNSTAHTHGQALGSMRDVLHVINLEVAAFRDRNRTDPNLRLRAIAPHWLKNMVVADLWRQSPGDGTLRAAESEMEGYLENAGVSITWALDGVPYTGGGATRQTFAALTGGQTSAFPNTVRIRIFHEGAHVFVGGGSLDFGIVRDSSLIRSNDFMVFAEDFEGLATPGFDPIYVDITTCPTGEAAALVDVANCGAGGS